MVLPWHFGDTSGGTSGGTIGTSGGNRSTIVTCGGTRGTILHSGGTRDTNGTVCKGNCLGSLGRTLRLQLCYVVSTKISV